MKDRPLLYSAPMVRATLADLKTQTRRVIKPQPGRFDGLLLDWALNKTGARAGFAAWFLDAGLHDGATMCPYGGPGDRLWVREAWRTSERFDSVKPSDLADWSPLRYEADDARRGAWAGHGYGGKLRPSMFMPRWASRITLEITGIRVERLQDISEADAVAEGIAELVPQQHRNRFGALTASARFAAAAAVVADMPKLSRRAFLGTALAASLGLAGEREARPPSPVELYALLWDSINGAGAWARNPWVWVVSFRRLPSGAAAAG